MSRIEKLLKAIINNTTYDEPRLSRIEEIFYSILYSLPYNADAQSRIEALLLALKESGLYDERTLSRIEEILKCKLDGSTYTGWIGSRVEMLLNEWELSEIIEATFTSFPIIIKANGEPLLDYTIYGNTVQNGTPTSDSPIMPEGTGEKTGNLLPEYPARTKTLDGVNWNVSSNGKITGNGTTTSGTNFYLLNNYSIPLKAGTYTLTFVGRKNISLILRNVTAMTAICAIWSTQSSVTFTIDNDIPETDRINLYFNTSQAGLSVDIDGYPMLNSGSTPLPYEPYGYKLTISSTNTTTPVYLGEVQTTRKIKKYVFTGAEDWKVRTSPDNSYSINYSVINTGGGVIYRGICSHFVNPQSGVSNIISGQCYFGTSAVSFRLDDTTDLTQWTNWLQQQYANGTPVTVWYVLAEPTTGIVNEPLMKIGDYADSVSMEQAGVSIPTLNKPNNTVIDVETTLKPSEMYVKYNGEGTRVYITTDSKLYITSNNEIYILKR